VIATLAFWELIKLSLFTKAGLLRVDPWGRDALGFVDALPLLADVVDLASALHPSQPRILQMEGTKKGLWSQRAQPCAAHSPRVLAHR
jgi:hypothetical protein